MARGGARPGAGRKPGSSTKLNEAERREAAAAGELPLQYALRIMRNPNAPQKRRDWACAIAMPFLHARFSSIEQTTPAPDAGGTQVSPLEAARRVAFAMIHGAMQSAKTATQRKAAAKV